MENPKVSVIISVYNNGKYLRTCINSAVNQTLKDIELICVDGGSTDGSIDVLQEYLSCDNRIKIFLEKDTSPGQARNIGISHATGEYIAFVNSDDYIDWDMCEHIYKIASSTNADIVVYGSISFSLAAKQADKFMTTKSCEYSNDSISALVYENGSWPFIWNKLYKREIIVDNNLFFPALLNEEHTAWLFIVFPKAKHIVYIPNRFYHCRQNHEESAMIKFSADKVSKLEQHKNIVEFVYNKWHESGDFTLYGQHWAHWCFAFLGRYVLHTSYLQGRSLGQWIVEKVAPFKDCLDDIDKKIFDDLDALSPQYTKIAPVSPAISIIIPVYNVEKHLAQCLESILKQTFTNFEIICVDDGSTDTSLKMLYRYAAIDKRIKILTQKNQYAGVARNNGMSVAKGEYCIFLDSDDFFEPDMLEGAYAQITKYDADICVFAANMYDNALKCFKNRPWDCRSNKAPQDITFSRKTNKKNIYQFTTANPWNKLFKKSFIEHYNLHFQHTRNSNDMSFVLLALSLAEKIIILPKIFVHYRKWAGSSLQSNKEKSILDFYETRIELINILKQYGVYEDVEIPLKNYLLDSCLYNLHTLHNPDAFKFLYFFLRDKAFKELDINTQDEEYWYVNPGNKIFQKREDIKVLTPSEYAEKYNLKFLIYPKVSIIIISQNMAKYISTSLQSLISQTLREIEIICVDSGSTDETLDIIKSFADKDSRIHLINSSIKNYGHQINLGISAANGEYIGIVKVADIAKPEMYEKLYKIAKEKKVDFIKSDYAKVDFNSKCYNKVVNPATEQEVFRICKNIYAGIYKHSFLEANNIKCDETSDNIWQKEFWFKILSKAARGYFLNDGYYICNHDNIYGNDCYNSDLIPNLVSLIIKEYNHVYKWLNDNNLLETFKGPFAYRKYDDLIKAFDKMPDGKKRDYSYILADEISKHIRSGEYVKEYFTTKEWEWIQILINNSEDFCAKRSSYIKRIKEEQIKQLTSKLVDTKKELKSVRKELNGSISREIALKNSISFRVGRAITWGPRKLRGGWRCYNQHGVSYTIKRLGWHIINLK